MSTKQPRNLESQINHLKERESLALDSKRDVINARFEAMEKQLAHLATLVEGNKTPGDLLCYIVQASWHHADMPLDTAIDLVHSFFLWMRNDEEKQR